MNHTPDRFGLLVLGLIVTCICIFASGTMGLKSRIFLVLLTLATLFIWIEPERTGAAFNRAKSSVEHWVKKSAR